MENIESPLLDFRQMLTNILNQRLLECNTYLQMPNEEWSIKIMGNLLLNIGVDTTLAAKD